MSPSIRKWIAPVVLLAALGFVIATYDQPADDAKTEVVAVVPKKEPSGKSEPKLQPGELDLARLARRVDAAEPGNAFESLSWYQAPVHVRKNYEPEILPPPRSALPNPIPMFAVVAELPAPPKPVAPPVPFTYLGVYQDSGKPTYFLVKGDQVYHVKEGDVIEGTYRVEGIEGTTLKLLYLPLNIRQTLNVGQAG